MHGTDLLSAESSGEQFVAEKRERYFFFQAASSMLMLVLKKNVTLSFEVWLEYFLTSVFHFYLITDITSLKGIQDKNIVA